MKISAWYTGSHLQRVKHVKENVRCLWVLIVSELFNITINDGGAKKSAFYSRVLVVTELLVSRTQCTYICGPHKRSRLHSLTGFPLFFNPVKFPDSSIHQDILAKNPYIFFLNVASTFHWVVFFLQKHQFIRYTSQKPHQKPCHFYYFSLSTHYWKFSLI